MTATPTTRHIDEAEKEVWSDDRGKISFRTVIGDGSTPTKDLCSGVARLEPGGWLGLHCHAAAEVYQVLTGRGVVILEGIEHAVRAGSGVYIPSNREHGIRNTGDVPLEFVYVYKTDSIDDVEYVWS
ncbi:cupin domain-containing protein [Brevibacterium sp.]|uniref:cupin domain-containing protein n=1 Tax=Brevibacterium sp. TaxID=1701 RepID=UPI002811E61E|nr:cupin domain-containing protein [Brevibacterium sp.]